jgi:hypothetical protein
VRGAAVGVALVAALALTGACDPSTRGPAPIVTTDTEISVPAVLIGVWGRSTDTMEVVIRFLSDGRYRSVEVYTPLQAGGVYLLQRVEDGVVQVDGQQMRLIGQVATLTRTAIDDPTGDHNDRPTAARTGTYAWSLEGDQLSLIDSGGTDAVFTRQQ